MKYRLPVLALITAGALLGACNKQSGDARTADKKPAAAAAIVDGKELSTDLLDFYSRSRTSKPLSELKPEEKTLLLDELISLQVAAQAAEKTGTAKEGDTPARLELMRLNVLADAQVAKSVPPERPSEQELRAEYETQIAALPKIEYRARHILVATEPYALSIIEKLQAGADFEQLARKESMDPGSKERGGELNWFMPTSMVPEFAKAVGELKKGEYTTKPVRTEFGFHVIRLEDTRPATPPAFETVKDRLAQMTRQRKVQKYIDDLKKPLKVEKKI